MQAVTEGNMVVAKLEDGERLMSQLLDLMEDQMIYSGVVLTGIGMLRDFTLNYFDGKRYVERQYPKPMELVSLHGSIAADSSIHLHAALSDKDTKMVGGHLSSATVNNIVELTILRLDRVHLGRKMKPGAQSAELLVEEKAHSVSIEAEKSEKGMME
ncbi:MAG: DUF296 domain-containing protein [Thermoplasmata archaeon]|nr:DUF296 domain-containing protein [Thermoplasmata archaeon]